ncbi:hypothetical protein [Aerosakkonema funiforme]|uniref:hypothetical protein n=1 Tax=Aerosakkonema funiforme TaxID=1246630 RepID=UPI0035BAF39F
MNNQPLSSSNFAEFLKEAIDFVELEGVGEWESGGVGEWGSGGVGEKMFVDEVLHRDCQRT